ncbi:hypothetical protein B2J88_35890 [Rhodococcus sp. SRB_17]|nr:hypothetical protein [Rhodococcus sp. SRB_17]
MAEPRDPNSGDPTISWPTEALRQRFSSISSIEAAKILYPNESDAIPRLEVLRGEGSLIRLPDGPTWEFPEFQFDFNTGTLIPIVAYANRAMHADTDPWGALSLWDTPIRILAGQTLVEILLEERLTEKVIDNLLASYRQTM